MQASEKQPIVEHEEQKEVTSTDHGFLAPIVWMFQGHPVPARPGPAQAPLGPRSLEFRLIAIHSLRRTPRQTIHHLPGRH